ncbi:MAG: hypothetical protein WCK41_02755 [Actinomycetes bacterium]
MTFPRHIPHRGYAVIGLIAAVTMLLGGCSGSATTTPTFGTFDFTPSATLPISDDGALMLTDITTGSDLPVGSIMVVTNVGTNPHRIVGTVDGAQMFDTGVMQSGNSTTVVISATGTVELRDVPTSRDLKITVIEATPN